MRTVTIVYDNEALQDDLISDWGFSCLVELKNRTLLFDTGTKGDILLHNMKKLDIHPSDIDSVFLSHNHHDHVGGLSAFRDKCPDAEIFRPDFSKTIKEFLPSLYTTGYLKGIEQSLIIKKEDGLVLIVGCSHPGLERIIKIAESLGDIKMVVGGFHGFAKFSALKGISRILPCHCTRYKDKIKNKFPQCTISCGAGRTVNF